MLTRLPAAAAILALTGCPSKSPKTASRPPIADSPTRDRTCDDVATSAEGRVEDLRGAGGACWANSWPQSKIDCFIDAPTDDEARACIVTAAPVADPFCEVLETYLASASDGFEAIRGDEHFLDNYNVTAMLPDARCTISTAGPVQLRCTMELDGDAESTYEATVERAADCLASGESGAWEPTDWEDGTTTIERPAGGGPMVEIRIGESLASAYADLDPPEDEVTLSVRLDD